MNKKKQLKQVNQGICNSQNRRAALSKRENSRVLSLKKRMSAFFSCFPGGTAVKNLNVGDAGDIRDGGSSLGHEDSLEEEMATHFSILA